MPVGPVPANEAGADAADCPNVLGFNGMLTAYEPGSEPSGFAPVSVQTLGRRQDGQEAALGRPDRLDRQMCQDEERDYGEGDHFLWSVPLRGRMVFRNGSLSLVTEV